MTSPVAATQETELSARTPQTTLPPDPNEKSINPLCETDCAKDSKGVSSSASELNTLVMIFTDY